MPHPSDFSARCEIEWSKCCLFGFDTYSMHLWETRGLGPPATCRKDSAIQLIFRLIFYWALSFHFCHPSPIWACFRFERRAFCVTRFFVQLVGPSLLSQLWAGEGEGVSASTIWFELNFMVLSLLGLWFLCLGTWVQALFHVVTLDQKRRRLLKKVNFVHR